MTRSFTFDEDLYWSILEKVAALSHLFSSNESPFLHSRFVENLFTIASGTQNIGRSDKIFDAVGGNPLGGVGVKTFLWAPSGKSEKIQEFTALSGRGHLESMGPEELVFEIARRRNSSILADCRELLVDLEYSIYHCLVRAPGGAFIHEESYPLIDISSIRPAGTHWQTSRKFIDDRGSIRFTDGSNKYIFRKAKSVLEKRFDVGRIPEGFRELPADPEIWTTLAERTKLLPGTELVDGEANMQPGVDFVVLPLYSTRDGRVPERSGINQWNARGRSRKFGEAYIPIPSDVRNFAPHFFPEKDVNFQLLLPGRNEPVVAKVCQEEGKALMSNPNTELCDWLYRTIDPDFRDEWLLSPPPSRKRPYTREDLELQGKDSVRIEKVSLPSATTYRATFSTLGSYEEFLQEIGELGPR